MTFLAGNSQVSQRTVLFTASRERRRSACGRSVLINYSASNVRAVTNVPLQSPSPLNLPFLLPTGEFCLGLSQYEAMVSSQYIIHPLPHISPFLAP